ncbi:MAG TPA: cellulase family glycosylhydrolase, partial [Ignavibacteriaceae bacterium]|nr:cellulase family glycosylhydrolase [Ignavibacteriaceae bacterium]
MIKKHLSVLCALFFIAGCSSSRFTNFITADKDKLMDGDSELRFVSFNIPNLHYIEDYLNFENPNPWRLPDEYEIRDALNSIKQMNGKVARMYVLSVRKQGESKKIIRHVEGPGVFNGEAFKALDKVMQVANELGVRIILPLVDNWWWWGGPAEYAAFRGKSKDEFWTDPQLISDFKKTINFIINRKNIYTGVLYKDDKALLGWETGNELVCPFQWTAEIARYIKSLDKNHLVIEGTHQQNITHEAIEDSNIDVLSTHHYTPADISVKNILKNKELSKGKKPYFVGEFGLTTPENIKTIVDSAINNYVSGIMIWSLRFHNRDGGFYMHRENRGFGSYRFPGFSSGNLYNEKEAIDFMQSEAFRVDGKKVPAPEKPAAPHLLEIKDVYDISWQGSTGVNSYIVERRESDSSSWRVLVKDISDAETAYKPIFMDTTAHLGGEYYYRVSAKNQSGISEPSNEAGPVKVDFLKIIDELKDSSKIYFKQGNLSFLNFQDIYRAKEDNGRLMADSGSSIIYKIPGKISLLKVFALKDSIRSLSSGLSFQSSSSLLDNFLPLTVKTETFPSYKNVYHFFTPVLFTVEEFPYQTKFL